MRPPAALAPCVSTGPQHNRKLYKTGLEDRCTLAGSGTRSTLLAGSEGDRPGSVSASRRCAFGSGSPLPEQRRSSDRDSRHPHPAALVYSVRQYTSNEYPLHGSMMRDRAGRRQSRVHGSLTPVGRAGANAPSTVASGDRAADAQSRPGRSQLSRIGVKSACEGVYVGHLRFAMIGGVQSG